MTVEKIRALADGKGLVDTFGFYYHKEADGIICHETNVLFKWDYLKNNIIMLDNLYII